MTISKTTTIADEIVDVLNGSSGSSPFSTSFTAVRYTLPMFNLKDLDEVQVSVVPRGRTKSIITRGNNQATHNIEIGIQKRLTDVNDPDEVDPLGLLVEEIEDALLGLTIDNATCIEINNILADDSLVARDHIQSEKVYTTVLVASFLETYA